MSAATSTETIERFISNHKLRMTVEWADHNPTMEDQNMDHWKCTIKAGRRSMTIHYSMGYGHAGAEPELKDVLDCLASDCSGLQGTGSFEDWCADYGYDTDSRRAERIYNAVEKQSLQLITLLGDEAYNALLYSTDRL